MTEPQRLTYQHPCARAVETLELCFHTRTVLHPIALRIANHMLKKGAQ
jgi:hypothetical protein